MQTKVKTNSFGCAGYSLFYLIVQVECNTDAVAAFDVDSIRPACKSDAAYLCPELMKIPYLCRYTGTGYVGDVTDVFLPPVGAKK